MRLFALVALAGLTIAGAAYARVWTDPGGRMTFDAPNGWATTVERTSSPENVYVISGSASNECHFVSQPSPSTATASADQVRQAGLDESRFQQDFWLQTATGMPQLFPGGSAQFVSRSLDTSGFWPIQRADLQSPERLIHMTLQLRPGITLMTMCMTYSGGDPVAQYETVSRSLGHPNDAAWRTEAEAAEAARTAAATAAAAAPPAQEPQQEGRRRRN